MSLHVPPEDLLVKAIRDSLNRRLNEIAEEEIKAAQERLARRIPEVVAGVGLALTSHLSFDRMGPDIRMIVTLKGGEIK